MKRIVFISLSHYLTLVALGLLFIKGVYYSNYAFVILLLPVISLFCFAYQLRKILWPTMRFILLSISYVIYAYVVYQYDALDGIMPISFTHYLLTMPIILASSSFLAFDLKGNTVIIKVVTDVLGFVTLIIGVYTNFEPEQKILHLTFQILAFLVLIILLIFSCLCEKEFRENRFEKK